MAYGKKFLVEFINVQKDIYHVYISEKDYEGNIIALRGATDKPFTTSQQSGDDSVFNAIRAKECTLNFVAENGISLLNFYSEDDEQFRIDFYCHTVNGVVLDKLLSSFFIVQDSCQQDLAAEPFEVSLKGTDNLALLKNIPFTSEGMPYHPANGSQYIGNISLFDFFKIALIQTGLGDLPLRIYSNVWENTINDRGSDATSEMFQQILIYTGKYLNEDGTWQDLYTILTDILKAFNCQLSQENGAWNIYRMQEASLFANEIPGVEHNLTTGDKTAITLDAVIPIIFGSETGPNGGNILDGADAISRIQRPFKFVKETFNYNQPVLINGADLKLPDNATPYESTADGNLRYDKYSLATYFPQWRQREDDASYLVVVTDTSSTPENEVDRYIYSPAIGGGNGGVQFAPIPVTKGDVMDFSLQFKRPTNSSNNERFWIRFILITTTPSNTALVDDPTNADLGWYWNNPGDPHFWDENEGWYYQTDAGQPKTDWLTWSFESIDSNTVKSRLKFPADGMLMIIVEASNGGNHSTNPRSDYIWKDINLRIENFINDSTTIIGQTHLNEQDKVIKNDYDETIQIDDSPRNSIAGTLFTDALTNFDYTDSHTGDVTGIGDIYFTRTKSWHRSNIAEERRLGEIIVYERMHQAFKPRTVIEGTLYGLRNKLSDDSWNFVSLLSIVNIDFLSSLNFIFGMLEVDWQNATYKAVLNELYQTDDTGEPFEFDYFFNYLFKTS